MRLGPHRRPCLHALRLPDARRLVTAHQVNPSDRRTAVGCPTEPAYSPDRDTEAPTARDTRSLTQMRGSPASTSRHLRIVICTGIYPPDIGGPATHARDLREELAARGHQVKVLTLTDAGATSPETVALSRGLPWPVRFGAVAWWLIRNRPSYDVVYATGLHGPAVLGAWLARRPVVAKVVGDPAWERGRRLGLVSSEFDAFQEEPGDSVRLRLMRDFRRWWSRRATVITVPSEYLRGVVSGWGVQPDSIVTIPNGVRPVGPRRPKARHDGLQIAFVGRLIGHKRLDVVLEAIRQSPRVTLEIMGDGPEESKVARLRTQLQLDDRVRLCGRMDHASVLDRLREADALVLASEYEGLPHVALEALACGTPVIAPRVGGIDEVITDGENGVLYESIGVDTVRASIGRLAQDPSLVAQLSERAWQSAEAVHFDRCADRLESLLQRAALDRPAVVMFGKSRVVRLGDERFRTKTRVLTRCVRLTWISVGNPRWIRHGGARLITLPASGPVGRALFYAAGSSLTLSLAVVLRAAIVCQSPFEAACVMALSSVVPSSLRPRIVVEVHGDWRAMSRLYGSRARPLLGPLADRVARWALRRADRVRVVSEHLNREVRSAGYRGEIDRYMTWTDFDAFLSSSPLPLPDSPHAVFIGVLERYKGVDVLISAWRKVTTRVPSARLTVLGDGPLAGSLRRQALQLGVEGTVTFERRRDTAGVRQLLDGATCLVIPSRSEGLVRVAFEAMARGRAVVASTVGGSPELVSDGDSGLLVPPDDTDALAAAMTRILADRQTAERMGGLGRRRAARMNPLAEYEAGTERLATWLTAANSTPHNANSVHDRGCD